MRYVDILIGFETEINKINESIDKPMTDDSLFWLNLAVDKFVKLRFNGDFVHNTGYEQTEKRRQDLIRLFKTVNLSITNYTQHNSYDSYFVIYPNDFLYALNEDVVISDMSNAYPMDTCVFECTQDSFMYRVNNSLTDFHYRYHRARPLRIRNTVGCELLTDKNYKVQKYTLGYLKKPNEITLDDPTSEYTDFEDSVMKEIIKIAALMYLENLSNERYKTLSQEVLTQE